MRNRARALLKAKMDLPQQGFIDEAWCRRRIAGYATLDPSQLYVDLTAPATINAVMQNRTLVRLASQLKLTGIDRGDLLGQKRLVTQTIARVIYDATSAGPVGLLGTTPA
ncbi:MAG: hypothetical protein M3014_01505 [Chloroflexota bacterium]|nr:hypothetical protein [Chloroflexota bacterium]